MVETPALAKKADRYVFGTPLYIPPYMDRHTMVIVILSLLLSAGLFLLPVNAEDDAGPDTSGYDLDLEGLVGGLLDNNIGVLMSPPHYQWNAEQYMDEADECAAKYKEYHTKFIDRGYIVYQQLGSKQGFTPLDKKRFAEGIFTDPDSVILGSIFRDGNDPQAIQYHNSMIANGACVQKNYDAALNKMQKDDFKGNAAVWDRAAGMFQMLGNDKRAQESQQKADDYREAANTKSLLDALFQPLPEFLAVLGVIGGLFLLHYRKEKKR